MVELDEYRCRQVFESFLDFVGQKPCDVNLIPGIPNNCEIFDKGVVMALVINVG